MAWQRHNDDFLWPLHHDGIIFTRGARFNGMIRYQAYSLVFIINPLSRLKFSSDILLK